MPKGHPKSGLWHGMEPLDAWVRRMQAEAPLCACGCGQRVVIKRAHRNQGVPEFIHTHHSRAKRGHYLGVDKWVMENRGKHLCACGCGELIEILPVHHATGIPRFRRNHSPRPSLGHGPEHPCFIHDRDRVRARSGRGFTPWTMKLIHARDGGRCRRCGSTRNLEYDHIRPIAHGGGAEPENGQLLCHECHRRKNVVDRAVAEIAAAALQFGEAIVAYLTVLAKEDEDGHHRLTA